jgi:glycosyltransferase involved in cell wall biosynthesis
VLQEFGPDIVIVHDPEWLPYLVDKKIEYKLVYNAHEYHPLEFDGDPQWMRTRGCSYYQLYKTCLPHVDILVNVCESIAKICRQEFGKESLVIPNASRYHPSLKANKVDGSHVKIIHHGLALRERRLEIMVEAAKRLGGRFTLDLMLVPSEKAYFEQLSNLVRTVPNVGIIDPVPYFDIAPFANQYDIGMYNLPPLSYNNRVALPNKVFEFLQARLCLVVSPSVEMARLVQRYNVGVVADGFDAAAFYEAIKRLDVETIENCKRNSALAAVEESAEKYLSEFVRVVLS